MSYADQQKLSAQFILSSLKLEAFYNAQLPYDYKNWIFITDRVRNRYRQEYYIFATIGLNLGGDQEPIY